MNSSVVRLWISREGRHTQTPVVTTILIIVYSTTIKNEPNSVFPTILLSSELSFEFSHAGHCIDNNR